MQIGPYTTERVLGEGGMGTVYLARQEEPIRREVALKLMRDELASAEARARFDVERDALSLMDHPHVARVLDAGITDAGRPYVAMELVSGLPIDQYCATNALTLHERVRLFIDVCHAVQHAHQKGVIHRDIKPSNILVRSVDGRPVPKVIDFGLAKALDGNDRLAPGATRWGQVLGTPEYMSPEQADPRGLPVDARTDVYSLGAVLYELLTGDFPVGRATLEDARFEEVLRRILKDDVEAPSKRLSTRLAAGDLASWVDARDASRDTRALRGDLDWIVLKALERDPELRYASPSELAADLQRHLKGEPVEAGPPSTLYRMRKFVQRNKTWVATGSLVLLLLVVGLIVSLTLWFQAVDALERVEAFVAGGIVQAEEDLWPLHPDQVPAMDRWLEEAEDVVRNEQRFRARLEAIEARVPRDESGKPRFRSVAEESEVKLLRRALKAIAELTDEREGIIDRVRDRRALAARLQADTIDAHAESWAAAAARVAKHPAFKDVVLTPQLGLVPLGPDPDSGLEEFAHLPSGAVPGRDPATKHLVLDGDSGFVFVLIPAGSYWMGAQATDPEARNYDEKAVGTEGLPRHVTLTQPFFLSKYECTNRQWRRLVPRATMPWYPDDNKIGGQRITPRNPREGISLLETRLWASRHRLRLPTEAEWEYACVRGLPAELRAGWGRGERLDELRARARMQGSGEGVHAEVGTRLPDALGLYDMLGNVAEWVHDIVMDGRAGRYATHPVTDPKGTVRTESTGVTRGGSYTDDRSQVRPSARDWEQMRMPLPHVGWRPARSLDP